MNPFDRKNLVQFRSIDTLVGSLLCEKYNVPHQNALDIAYLARDTTKSTNKFSEAMKNSPHAFGEYNVYVSGACDFVYLLIDKNQDHIVTLELET